MHRTIASFLAQFAKEHEVLGLEESEQFERFVNYCVVSQHYPEAFDVSTVSTSTDEPGIDGIAAVINGTLVCTKEDALSVFRGVAPRRSVDVLYLLVQSKTGDAFDLGDMLKLGTGASQLFSDSYHPADDLLSEFKEIHEVVVENLSNVTHGRPDIELHYACTGEWRETTNLRSRALSPSEAVLRRLGLFHQISFNPIDRELLTTLWIKTRSPVQATFPVKGVVPMPAIGGVAEAYLCLVQAKPFIKNVLSDEEGRLRPTVFEQNVRAFLGDDNAVNRRMREALAIPASHDRFAINNNGITIVSSDVKVQNDRISVTDFQIVNGCQTSHTLYRNQDLMTDDVWLSVKVIEADDPDIVAQLVESTNSQTNVDETQFLSIKPFAISIESYFNSFEADAKEKDRRLYFERRTNQYAGEQIGRSRIFDIVKLARCVAAMFLDLPHIAYMYPTQVLRERGRELFQANHAERMYYTAALVLYRLELALGNNYVPRDYMGHKWHLMMVVRYLIAGPNMPRFDSPKMERYCEAIEKVFLTGGRPSSTPFLEAASILAKVGHVSRDRRKGQPYTEDIRTAAKAAHGAASRRRSR